MIPLLATTGMIFGLVGAGSLRLRARRLLRLDTPCEISPIRVVSLIPRGKQLVGTAGES